jgi:hypothetical protein
VRAAWRWPEKRKLDGRAYARAKSPTHCSSNARGGTRSSSCRAGGAKTKLRKDATPNEGANGFVASAALRAREIARCEPGARALVRTWPDRKRAERRGHLHASMRHSPRSDSPVDGDAPRSAALGLAGASTVGGMGGRWESSVGQAGSLGCRTSCGLRYLLATEPCKEHAEGVNRVSA